ncbi:MULTISPECIES: FAD-dependent oxidoreductase [Nonomuraea]|uniref:FAD-dependent oxidoreductase n=1 Tax=Nonomuraea salmonea TaxID=46181 RepID=A0ABV5P3P8_9ACTN
MARRARIVVVGAGFAGLAATKELARTGALVTVVDRNPYATFQPLLYQVATAGMSTADVSYPIRTFAARWPNVRARRRRCTGAGCGCGSAARSRRWSRTRWC